MTTSKTDNPLRTEQFHALARLYAAGIRLSCTYGVTDSLPGSNSQMRDIVGLVRNGDLYTLGVHLTNSEGSLFVSDFLDHDGSDRSFCSIAPARFDHLIQVRYNHDYAQRDITFSYDDNGNLLEYHPEKSTLISLNRVDRDKNWKLVVQTHYLGECTYTIDERLTVGERKNNLQFDLHRLVASDLSQ